MIAVDLGYGFTKAVSEKSKVIFPSAVAPAADLVDFGKSIGHVLEYRRPGEIQKQRLFVGELAVKEGRAVEASLSRDKFSKEISAVLALTASYLLGAERHVNLATGLPLAYYKSQKNEVKEAFQKINAYISIDGGPEKHISFSKVHVFPQGVGAVYAQEENLPEEGLVGLIDIGYYTTDYVLFECTPDDIIPLKSYISSVETGVSTALKLLVDSLKQKLGVPISLSDAQAMFRKRCITFRGKRKDIGPDIDRAVESAGRVIVESIISAWSEKIDWIDEIILAGGGAVEFYDIIRERLPVVRIAGDPQFANALGFLAMAEPEQEHQEQGPDNMVIKL